MLFRSPWSRPSPVAARTLILECERIFGNLDEVVLYFDESYFATKFHSLTMQNCSQTFDDALLGYQYLTLELLSRFEKNFLMNASLGKPQTVPKLVFLIRNSVNEFDIKKNAALRTDLPAPSNALGPTTGRIPAGKPGFESTASKPAPRES